MWKFPNVETIQPYVNDNVTNDLREYDITSHGPGPISISDTHISYNNDFLGQNNTTSATISNFLIIKPGNQYYVCMNGYSGLASRAHYYLKLFDDTTKYYAMGGGEQSSTSNGSNYSVRSLQSGWIDVSYKVNQHPNCYKNNRIINDCWTDSAVRGWIHQTWEIVERVVTTDISSIYNNEVVKDIKVNLYNNENDAMNLSYQGTWGYVLENQSDELIANMQKYPAQLEIYTIASRQRTQFKILRLNLD